MIRPLLFALAASACTASTVSPPLTARGSPDPRRTFGSVHVTSGAFKRPHRVIGVMQMTASGYKWLHEIEIADDARPDSLLHNVGSYALRLGAHGIQHLDVIDLDPRTPGEVATAKVDSVVRIERALEKKQYASIAGEGTRTRWQVRGELIQFLD